MKNYSVVKAKAKEFANERNNPVYIAKASGNNHYRIVFDESQISEKARHNIVEMVYPNEKENEEEREL